MLKPSESDPVQAVKREYRIPEGKKSKIDVKRIQRAKRSASVSGRE
jgi:hypothetical protein